MSKAILTPKLLAFMRELSENNDRDWFKANKARYEAEVREPALDFVRAMAPRLAGISPHLVADERKTGGSMFRIYRDTRFSKDKTPYKDHVGIAFGNKVGKAKTAPGYYLHLGLDGVWAGVGMWQPPNPTLAEVRAKIDAEQERWLGIVEDETFAATWKRSGEQLKRAPKGYPKDHPLVDDLRYKSHIAGSELSEEDLYTVSFPDLLAERYAAAAAFVRFLSEAVGVDF